MSIRHRGRGAQVWINLGKMLRMFVYQNDWKVLPMAAIIAGMVSMAVGKGLFVTMEGTFQGTFALTCVCIWNGFFNSIQAICKERAIVKREHRAGMHITSYVAAHLAYQLILCILQVAITIVVLIVTGVTVPKADILFGPIPDLFITMVLITYSADVMALMISAIVKSSMAAMTVMPFVLIVQLVLSGFIPLPEALTDVTKLMVSKWGVTGLCTISNYNDLPEVMIWYKMMSSGDKISVGGGVSVKDIMDVIQEERMQDAVLEIHRQQRHGKLFLYEPG